jgi:plastocyanin
MRYGMPLRAVRAVVLLALMAVAAGTFAAQPRTGPLRADPALQPPIADPVQLVNAYYQTLAAAVNSGDFTPLLAFFTPDAGINSPLALSSASGPAGILAFYQSLPPMQGLTIEVSNVLADDPYVDADWRFRAAPGSLRGYLDGHDTFTIRNGLIAAIEQQVDPQEAADAFMPPPAAPAPTGPGKATTMVRIADYAFKPAVIRVKAGATVTWTNDDADDHAVTTDDKTMDAGVAAQGVSISLTFTTPGDYPYYCTVHPGMRGRVIVTGP